MNVGILGTGFVGQTLATKIQGAGHEVMMGTRDVDQLMHRPAGGMGQDMPFTEWHQQNTNVKLGTFAQAASHGEVLFNCTAGRASLDALEMAGSENLEGKVLIDIANPLAPGEGRLPILSVANTDSLGEQIQKAFPRTKVVKALNTMNARVMVDPLQLAEGDHDVFLSGEDPEAKAQVTEILRTWFGWKNVIDLGGIETARGAEMILPIWIRLMGALGSKMFNFKVATE